MPKPKPIGRGVGRAYGSRKLRKHRAASKNVVEPANENPARRRRGPPPGTGKWQVLRAQLARAAVSVSLDTPAELPLCPNSSQENIHVNAGTSMAIHREETTPSGAPLRRCSWAASAAIVLLDSLTENSGILSTFSEPLNGDRGVTSKLELKEEKADAGQELRKDNSQGNNRGVPENVSEHKTDRQKGTCKSEKWDSLPLMKAITQKHGDITKSCKFQSQTFKTHCLDGVCKVVKKLQETRFAEINADLLKELYSFIEDAESVNLDVTWLRNYVDEVADTVKSTIELARLEEAEKVLRQNSEDKQKAIQEKRVHVAKLQAEIEVQEEELALALLSNEQLLAQIRCLKSRCHNSNYLTRSLP